MKGRAALALALLLLAAAPARAQDDAVGGAFGEQLLELGRRVESLAERSPTFADAMRVMDGRLLLLPGDLRPPLLGSAPGYERGSAVVLIDMGPAHLLTDAQWDALLAHELYGHALPWIRSGTRCRDPQEGQRWEESCVAIREARILEELGRTPRLTYIFPLVGEREP